MEIAVLGAGSWGTALAVLLGEKKYSVKLWGRRKELTNVIQAQRENKRYLPNIAIPANVNATSDIDEAVSNCDVLVLAVPSTGVKEVALLIKGKVNRNVLLVHAGKGLDSATGKRGSEVIAETLGGEILNQCVVLSGPNLAMELAKNVPTATVVAGSNQEFVSIAQELFSSPALRVYRNLDIIGVELGGALKNIYAIGAGISDGLGFGDNTKATLVTRGLAEMMRLGTALGANPKTFTGLSGVGDLMATCASKLSRNLRLGEMVGQGKGIEESLKVIGQVAEGMHTCEAAYFLSKKHEVSMPITEQIYAVLFENKPPRQAVLDLMSRDNKEEFG